MRAARLGSIIASAILLTAIGTTFAAPAIAAKPVEHSLQSLDSGPYRPDAMALADQIMPLEPFTRMMRYMVVAGLRDGLGEQAKLLEKQSPGIIRALVIAADQAANPFLTGIRDTAMRRYARLYSRELTEAEVAELRAFFSTAVGRKLIAAKFEVMMSDEFTAVILESPTTSESDIRKFNRGTAREAVKQMTPAELRQLDAFSRAKVFPKLKALQPVIARLEADQANEPAPEMEAAVASAMRAVFERRQVKV